MDDKYTDKQVCDILADNHFSNLLQYVLHMFGTMPRSMTEEEIIQYLKMNKNVGVVFGFMPSDVQDWVKNNSQEILCYGRQLGNENYEWLRTGFHYTSSHYTSICALPDDFQIEEKKVKSEGHWAEFDIDKKGYFQLYTTHHHFLWCRWSDFLDAYRNDEYGEFITFGGWQYENDSRWYLAPAIQLNDGKLWNSYVIEDYGEAKPVIPVKIRFWRVNK